MPTIRGAPIGGLAIAAGVFASIGGFLFGYDTGQIADFLVMNDFKLRFAQCAVPGDVATCQFSTVRSGLIVAMLSVGTLFGSLIGAFFADRLGRKLAVQLDCLIVIVGTIIQISASTSWQQLTVGRAITGLGVGALSACIPLFQSEIAAKEIRGSLVSTYQLAITFGILVAYCISIGTRNIDQGGASWRIVVGLNMLWALVLAIGFIFLPESPRWLMARGRPEDAEKSLARYRGVKVEDNDYSVRTAFVEMEEAVRLAKKAKVFGWLDCFKPRDKLLYRTVLLMTLQALQQLTGANYFFYYGATVLGGVGINDEFVAQIILGAVNFVCTFGGIYVMERFGRRTPLIIGGLWQSAWLFVYAAAGTARDPLVDKGIGKLMIVATCLFIAGYAMTWAPGVWTVVGETPRNDARAKTGALATSSNWLWNFLLAFFTPFITRDIGYSYGFVFAGCNLAGAIIVFFFLYESSNLSLENVDKMYNDKRVKPWNSKSWRPEGHESRGDYVNGRKAEGKFVREKPQHRELVDDASQEGTFVGDGRLSNATKA
ncbi:sugar porter family MFS transporter [Sporobolomyces koalae]|uniref:sugar porter family MFS transporter n=1 Tax=Sporobolomyces koalae TaxID=500713 RepID=UPI0031730274